MPDKPANPSPEPQPRRNDPLSALAANDIDQLLAEAESLASVVAHEVGVAADHPGQTDSKDESPPGAATAPASSGAVEETVSQIESLLAGRVEQPPTQPAEPTGRDQAAGPGPAEATPVSATKPASTAAAETDAFFGEAPASASAGAEAVGGDAGEQVFLDTGTDNGIGAATPEAATPPEDADRVVVEAELAAAADAATASQEATEEPGGLVRRLRSKIVRGLKAAPRRASYAPLYLAVGLLRLLDLPFARMSTSLKSKLGYVGVVTAIMAGVAWALVLFGGGNASP